MGKGGRKRKDTWKEGQKTEREAHSAHLGLTMLLNVLAVLRNELLVLLTHIIEDLGEIRARGNIYLHTNISIILPVSCFISCQGRRGHEVGVGSALPSSSPLPQILSECKRRTPL